MRLALAGGIRQRDVQDQIVGFGIEARMFRREIALAGEFRREKDIAGLTVRAVRLAQQEIGVGLALSCEEIQIAPRPISFIRAKEKPHMPEAGIDRPEPVIFPILGDSPGDSLHLLLFDEIVAAFLHAVAVFHTPSALAIRVVADIFSSCQRVISAGFSSSEARNVITGAQHLHIFDYREGRTQRRSVGSTPVFVIEEIRGSWFAPAI